MPDDLLPPPGPPAIMAPPVAVPRASTSVTCEFCGCVLAPNGDVLKRGEEATRFQKLDDRVADLQDQLNKAVTALRTAETDLAALKQPKKTLIPL